MDLNGFIFALLIYETIPTQMVHLFIIPDMVLLLPYIWCTHNLMNSNKMAVTIWIISYSTASGDSIICIENTNMLQIVFVTNIDSHL